MDMTHLYAILADPVFRGAIERGAYWHAATALRSLLGQQGMTIANTSMVERAMAIERLFADHPEASITRRNAPKPFVLTIGGETTEGESIPSVIAAAR